MQLPLMRASAHGTGPRRCRMAISMKRPRWAGRRTRRVRADATFAWPTITRIRQGLGHGHGIGFGGDYEFKDHWMPFGRLGFNTRYGSSIKEVETAGAAHVLPFGRKGDLFGAATTITRSSTPASRREQLTEFVLSGDRWRIAWSSRRMSSGCGILRRRRSSIMW